MLAWMVNTAVTAAIILTVFLPRLTGATPYTILTGSMEPTLPPGTLVIVKPVEPDQIGVGTVITYQMASGSPDVVTHRVVSQGVNGMGDLVFRTRGDANSATDKGLVVPAQIRGKVWFSVPYLGYATALVTGTQHQALTYLAIASLLLYAAAMFLKVAQRRRRARAEAAAQLPEDAPPHRSEGPAKC
jgi:signal peptidase